MVWAKYGQGMGRGQVVALQGLENYLTIHKRINNTND
jgi:hypothetical protein